MVLFFSAESLEEYAEEHADVHNTHKFTICDLYNIYLYIYRYIYTYIWCKQQASIYTYIYTCNYLCIPSLGSCVIIYVKMSKCRVNGPLMSLPKLSGQRSGRKGLQRFRKGVMHLLFRRFFFHLSLSLCGYLLRNMATLAALPWLFPVFLVQQKPWKTAQGFGKGKGKGQADIVPWTPFFGGFRFHPCLAYPHIPIISGGEWL